jgi:hypothetical protein
VPCVPAARGPCATHAPTTANCEQKSSPLMAVSRTAATPRADPPGVCRHCLATALRRLQFSWRAICSCGFRGAVVFGPISPDVATLACHLQAMRICSMVAACDNNASSPPHKDVAALASHVQLRALGRQRPPHPAYQFAASTARPLQATFSCLHLAPSLCNPTHQTSRPPLPSCRPCATACMWCQPCDHRSPVLAAPARRLQTMCSCAHLALALRPAPTTHRPPLHAACKRCTAARTRRQCVALAHWVSSRSRACRPCAVARMRCRWFAPCTNCCYPCLPPAGHVQASALDALPPSHQSSAPCLAPCRPSAAASTWPQTFALHSPLHQSSLLLLAACPHCSCSLPVLVAPARCLSSLLLLAACPRCSCSLPVLVAPARCLSSLLLLAACPRCSCSLPVLVAPARCLSSLLLLAACRPHAAARTWCQRSAPRSPVVAHITCRHNCVRLPLVPCASVASSSISKCQGGNPRLTKHVRTGRSSAPLQPPESAATGSTWAQQ